MDLSFGSRLRAQREQRQVTLTAIAEETKISVAVLEGLERDDLSRWPGGLFRRAYVRSYAQAVGLEPEAVVREFLERHPEPVVEDAAALAVQVAANEGSQTRASTALGRLRAGLASLRPLRGTRCRPADTPVPAVSEEVPLDLALPEPPLPAVTEAPSVAEPSAAIDAAEPSAAIDAGESSRRRPAVRTMKRPNVRTGSSNRMPHREPAGLERDLASVARLCMALACACDQSDVSEVLGRAARLIKARGAIIWVWDAMYGGLRPAVSYGYSNTVLRQLPRVGINTDNAVATAFRSKQLHVVEGHETSTGAIAAPLLTPGGCVGVLAFELGSGGEHKESARAFATIFGAQLSMLVPVSVLAEAVSA